MKCGSSWPGSPRTSPNSSKSPRPIHGLPRVGSASVYLGEGVLWYCSSEPHVQAVAEDIAASFEKSNYKVTVSGVMQALAHAQKQVSSQPSTVQVLIPEASAELDFCRWDGDGHHDLSSYAAAGPPTLGQVITFLRMVDTAVASTPTVLLSSMARQADGALLAGAVLVLARGLSAEDAWARILKGSALPPDAAHSTPWHRFPRTWSKDGRSTSSSATVLDCLAGLQAARELGWLADYRSFDVASWRLLRRQLNCTWVIPGEVLAMAHPMETAENPVYPGLLACCGCRAGAATRATLEVETCESSVSPLPNCSSFLDFLDAGGLCEIRAEAEEASASFALIGSDDSNEQNQQASLCCPRTSPPIASPGDTDTGDVPLSADASGVGPLEAEGFTSYLVRQRIGMIARLNHPCERPDQGLCSAEFEAAGLSITDFAFQDGSVPSKQVVKAFMDDCKVHLHPVTSPIAVHCMAGMGRTGVLVGAYAVGRHRISGKAFHGWMRMCRPGSVQTERQEIFLRSLKPPSLPWTRSISSAGAQIKKRVASFGSVSDLSKLLGG